MVFFVLKFLIHHHFVMFQIHSAYLSENENENEIDTKSIKSKAIYLQWKSFLDTSQINYPLACYIEEALFLELSTNGH